MKVSIISILNIFPHLCDDKLPRRIVPRHEVGVDEIRSLLVVRGLQLDPAVVVGEDVGEPVLGAVHGEVGGDAGHVTTNVLQLLVFFGEPVIEMC